jgi:FSR family fosmidomycin resistance protein-like MFS transporter
VDHYRERYQTHYRLPLLLGLAHAVSDGAAGWLLGNLAHQMPLTQLGTLVLLYNVLAFGAQPLAGLLADHWQRPRLAAAAGLGCMVAALVAAPFDAWAAVVLAGTGSALFHVGGGGLALCVTPQQASGPGLFAAPGVIGLALGGAAAMTGIPARLALAVTLLALAAVVARQALPQLPYHSAERPDAQHTLETHDWIMMVLLAAIALRSAVWGAFQYVPDGQTSVLVGLALAAALGKIAGGFLADRFGWRRWTMAALLAAIPLLALGSRIPAWLYLGVALLQSATPAMVAMLAASMPRLPATAAGLAFGLAIALGGLPALAGAAPFLAAPPGLVVMVLLAMGLVWFSARGLPAIRYRRYNRPYAATPD